MRIFQVTHFFASRGGGIELVARRLVDEWRSLGHRVTWAATRELGYQADYGSIGAQGLNPTERWLRVPFPLWFPLALFRVAKHSLSADVMVVHDAAYLHNFILLMLRVFRRQPVLLVQHVGKIEFNQPLLRLGMAILDRLLVRVAMRAADQVVFVGKVVKDSYINVKFKRPPLLIYNGVDSSLFHFKCKTENTDLRLFFLFVGRFVERKGIGKVIGAARSYPQADFKLAGSGDLTRFGELPNNVEVLGQLSPLDLAEAYLQADALILPSYGEGFPLVVQEALCCGCPAIVSDEIIRACPEITSISVNCGSDEEAFVAALGLFFQHADQWRRKRREIAATASRMWSWQETARHYDRVMASLVSAYS